METLKITSKNELNNFLDLNKDNKISYKCTRDNDDYNLIIEAGHHVTTDRYYCCYCIIARVSLKIAIDTKSFLEAYSDLEEVDQLPKQYKEHHPFYNYENMQTKYIICFVETRAIHIMDNLEAFNHQKDNYTQIAKLAVINRGRILGKMHGI